MKYTRTTILAWVLCAGLIIHSLFVAVGDLLATGFRESVIWILGDLAWNLIPATFGVIGALIVSRQSRNVIGWLMILPATLVVLDGFVTATLTVMQTAPAEPSLWVMFVLWFSNTGWILLIFPILFIAQLFPTGTPLSPRWRWLIVYGIVLIAIFFGITLFAQTVGPDPTTYGVDWLITNPIGFLDQQTMEGLIFPWWISGLAILSVLSAVCLILRYRRAQGVEKEQIKWLLYVGGLFALVYAPHVFLQGNNPGPVNEFSNLVLPLLILGFPLAIGIAILRYRLWDIDVIIRRTLTYALVTAFLAIVFFGSVILLQQLFASVTGSRQNEIVTVFSTLAIAALFVPVRNRVQSEIDKRFNRKKYNAQQVLQDFANTVRDETDLDRLAARLMQVVDETMQPRSVSVWLKKEAGKQGNR